MVQGVCRVAGWLQGHIEASLTLELTPSRCAGKVWFDSLLTTRLNACPHFSSVAVEKTNLKISKHKCKLNMIKTSNLPMFSAA